MSSDIENNLCLGNRVGSINKNLICAIKIGKTNKCKREMSWYICMYFLLPSLDLR